MRKGHPIIRGNPDPDGVFCLYSYTPWRVHQEMGTAEQVSDGDRHVMNMKPSEIGKARQEKSVEALLSVIKGLLEPPVIVVPVPPSKKAKPRSGLYELTKRLAEHTGAEDGGGVLVRTEDKDTAHLGGERSVEASYRTMSVANPAALRGKRVLLIDDMCKTGSEMAAARRHMTEAGAAQVEALAIGCTGGATIVKPD